jgi:hypothetical protein
MKCARARSSEHESRTTIYTVVSSYAAARAAFLRVIAGALDHADAPVRKPKATRRAPAHLSLRVKRKWYRGYWTMHVLKIAAPVLNGMQIQCLTLSPPSPHMK